MPDGQIPLASNPLAEPSIAQRLMGFVSALQGGQRQPPVPKPASVEFTNRISDWWNNQPSWADKLHQETTADQQAFAQGGPHAMLTRDPTNALNLMGGFAGSVMDAPLYHGSPVAGLSTLQSSSRGPLGPGVYSSPAEGIAKSYAGESGSLYQLPSKQRDIYQGIGHRTDAEWAGFKNDKQRLINAAEPDKQQAVSDILDKMWSGDGYPAYQRLRQLYGGHEGAQGLFKRAGFQGISGLVDGPEVLLFGDQPVAPPLSTLPSFQQ